MSTSPSACMVKLPSGNRSELSHVARDCLSITLRASSVPNIVRAFTAAYVGAKWDN